MEGLKDWLRPDVLWFVAGVALILMEFAMPGLIIIFFGIGACLVGVLCLFCDPSLNVQLLVFLATSVVLLVVLRRWCTGIFKGHGESRLDLDKPSDNFVGETATVLDAIEPGRAGKVEFHGTPWKAEADDAIPEGCEVEVVESTSLTLKVKRHAPAEEGDKAEGTE